MSATATLAAAVEAHRAGRLDEAAAAYRTLLAANPDHADALNLLGVVLVQQNTPAQALPLLQKATTLKPNVADYWNTFGEALRASGQPGDAATAFATALKQDPLLADAHNNLGVVALAGGRAEEAIDCFRAALAIDDRRQYRVNLGRALSAAGRFGEALAPLRKAAEEVPGDAACLRLLGLACHNAGHLDEAAEALRAATALAPGDAGCWAQLGLALQAGGDRAGCIDAYHRALALDKGLHQSRNNLGVALVESGDFAAALAAYETVLAAEPANATAHNNMAMALHKQGKAAAAERHYEAALEGDPGNADTLNNFGNLRIEQGRVSDGLALYDRALAADPANDHAFVNRLARSSLVCAWAHQSDMLAALRPRVDTALAAPESAISLLPLTFTLPYFCSDRTLIHDVCRAIGAHYHQAGRGQKLSRPPAPDAAEKRLHIGYLSPDFGDHPISHVTLPIYGLHDREGFRISCYATLDRSAAGGRYLERIRSHADAFVDLSGASHADAAQRIADDGVDILVDMGGYMRHSRPQVLALRPAPLQMYWQGHTGSLGTPDIDYVIGDGVVMPQADDSLYTEKIIRLPDSFSSADRHPVADQPGCRADYGLPEDGVVFCAFNNPLKIEASVFAAWMRILAGVPGSVLWLSRASDPATVENLGVAAAAAGIDPARLVTASRVPDKAVHLARHALADLFLDTFLFNASTTALDALWAGLPVLAKRGDSAYSRLSESYLRSLGLGDLVCRDTEAYVARAIALAADGEARAALRARLTAARLTTPLFDGACFVRHLEAAYRQAWRRRCAGEAACSFALAAAAEGAA
jgi:protein O-GlcNAc transferase